MKVKLSSVMVDDQDKALRFYTEALGFVKKNDIPMGEARWLTVVSPQAPDDIQNKYERMKKLRVEFRSEPKPMGPTTAAVFDDTCGNLIQLYEA
jgi:catechol 2,3-dioxygenase-like lactoylglutathione lyase family enzyme